MFFYVGINVRLNNRAIINELLQIQTPYGQNLLHLYR